MVKRFGFDIDGVLTAEGRGDENIWTRYLARYLDDRVEIKENSYDFCRAYDISRSTLEDFLQKYLTDIYASVPPAPAADAVLKELKENNSRIILITARDSRHRKTTENWLEKHGIEYDRLIHDSDKARQAEQMNLELFVDDKKENVISLNEIGVPVLLFDRHHNQDLDESHYLARVDSWSEIKNIIEERFYL